MRRVYLAVLLALIAGLAACSRSAAPGGQIAILRFENLTGDPVLDWMGRGAARAIAAQIDGAIVADSTQRAEERERVLAAGNHRILHGYLSAVNGRLRLRADVEEAPGKFLQSAEASGAAAAGLPPLADAVAHSLDAKARPPVTKSNPALEAYIAALDARDRGAAVANFQRAIAADPNFAGPYLALIEYYQAVQDRPSAERMLAEARTHAGAFSSVDQARLDAGAAQLANDPAALSKALTTLSRLTPEDARLLRTLAETETQAKRFDSAAGYLRKALAIQPDDVNLLNNLGYTLALAGDLDGAVKALSEYARLRPAEANPLDSLGDVHFYWNKFAEAEQFYKREYKKEPAFLNGGSMVKASAAALFNGDAKAADANFAEYEAARRAANDALIDYNRDAWDYIRGKRSEAVANLERFAAQAKTRDLASLAHSTLTIWLLDSGDRDRARKHATQASASAASPAMSVLAATCGFISAPAGSVAIPNPAIRAYALLLGRDFGAAIPLLREIESRATPSVPEPSRVLLAWALIEAGQAGAAAPYLRNTPVLAVSGPAPFESLLYPRIFHLRAVVAEKSGDAKAAAQNQRLFDLMSGRP